MNPTDDKEPDTIEGPPAELPDVKADPRTGELPDGWEWADE